MTELTEAVAPSELYLQLQARLGKLRDLQGTTLAAVREYQQHDPCTLDTDTLGEPITGPEAVDAVALALGRLDQALAAADEALQEALAYASRLRLKH